jgi:peroxiredoxin
MKKIIVAVLPAFLFLACEQKDNKGTIKGTITKMGTGEIYLIKSGDEQKIDTIKVVNDAFTYTTSLEEPTVYMANFGPEQQPGFFILENGTTTLNYEMGNLKSLTVKGGAEQEVYNSFLNACRPTFQQMDSLGQIAMANEDNTALLQELQQVFYTLDNSLKAQQLDFINKHKSNIGTAFIAVNYLNEKMDKTYTEVDNLYQSLDEKVKKSYYGKKLVEMANQMKGTSIGQPAPAFTLNDVNGKPVDLASFKGKITLIDFWASWCGPCRAENPNVVKAFNAYKGKGFTVLGVSLDDNKNKWLDAIKKDGLAWTQVSDLKGWYNVVAVQFGIQSIPANYLIDPNGVIIGKDLRGADLEAALAAKLK